MMFRSAMCPNCDSLIKLDTESETVFCANCGIQIQAKDAFVYYGLKTGNETEIAEMDSYRLLLRCGADFLEQKKHDLADACFANILSRVPEDYLAWKMRAFTWESRIVNEYRKSFYEYNVKSGFVENREYLDKYREFCDNAVRHSPGDITDRLAEEFNDHIRTHFNMAYRAYRREKRKSTAYAALAAITMFALAALALNSCRF